MTSEDNAKSKELLLASIDDRISYSGLSKPVRDSLIMNRNRVAKFLDLPIRKFKEN
jgi:hypothetical protein